ncbi:MAG: hypothetical protein QXE22_01860 [Candidatus Bathyarchaeia archaeon]
MVIFELSSEQIEILKGYVQEFKEWLKTPKGQANVREHREHERYFKERLSSDNLDKMTSDEFREVYKTLWASNIWGNKDWYVDNRLLGPNGLETIKRELKKLLYGAGGIDARYDEFRKNVKGFGPSLISEILHFVFPEKYCLWNEKPKSVLPFLGLTLLPDRFFKHQITSGSEYLQCVNVLKVIKDELKNFGILDFIDLDVFFWHIYDDVMTVKLKAEKEVISPIKPRKVQISDHDGAEYYLLELGNMLGFLTYVASRDQTKIFEGCKLGDVALLKEIPPFAGERDLNSAREIDVIWFGEDENPKYCFEVEHTMDILRSLNRLAQLQHIYAKFFIIAPEERRPKFEVEMQKYPYRRMRDRYRFVSYNELASLFETAQPFHKLKTKLLGEG